MRSILGLNLTCQELNQFDKSVEVEGLRIGLSLDVCLLDELDNVLHSLLPKY